jgi:hypothetical protein
MNYGPGEPDDDIFDVFGKTIIRLAKPPCLGSGDEAKKVVYSFLE